MLDGVEHVMEAHELTLTVHRAVKDRGWVAVMFCRGYTVGTGFATHLADAIAAAGRSVEGMLERGMQWPGSR